MTTRRDVLTGLAALPILPAAASAAEPSPMEQALAPHEVPPNPEQIARPEFIHRIDDMLFSEIELMEVYLKRLKAELVGCNYSSPILRGTGCFIMGCTFNSLRQSFVYTAMKVAEQREQANAATIEWERQHEPQA